MFKKTLLSISSIFIISSCTPQTATFFRGIIIDLLVDQVPNAVSTLISALDSTNQNLVDIQQDSKIEKSEYETYKEKVASVIEKKRSFDSKLDELYTNSNSYMEALKKRLTDIKDQNIRNNSEKDVLEIQNNLIPKITEVINFSKDVNKDIQSLKDIEAALEIKMGLDLVKDSVNKAYEIKSQLVTLQNKINSLKQEGSSLLSNNKASNNTTYTEQNLLSNETKSVSNEQLDLNERVYTIQVASRKSYDEAVELSNKLPDSKVRTKISKGNYWNTVTVGEFSTKENAESYMITLKENYSNAGNSDDVPEAFISKLEKFEK